ncbi:hypothetical protein K488DRAFT_90187 [Vararia minispora EC-137]|uniref:Uncharacterized protein n=1 Tax=Vararia minispora EC-137 TaxID=1314806 RepID=A0ACB8Q871_9AGAM|nr:hypothetical protein K488DRAFT_90187 [Vararia minispora EC-137]
MLTIVRALFSISLNFTQFIASAIPALLAAKLRYRLLQSSTSKSQTSLRHGYEFFRYDRNALNHTEKDLWELDTQLSNDQKQQDAFLSSIAYPFWGFPVQEDHDYGILSQTKLPEKMKSNNADLLLYVSPDEQPAFVEVKAWWVVSAASIERYLQTLTKTERFNWYVPGKMDNNDFVVEAVLDRTLLARLQVHRSYLELHPIFLGLCMVTLDTCLGGPRWHFPGGNQVTKDKEWKVWRTDFQSRVDRLVEAICPKKSRFVKRNAKNGMFGAPESPSTGKDPLTSWVEYQG